MAIHVRTASHCDHELDTYETITLLYMVEESCGFLIKAETGINAVLDVFTNALIDELIRRGVFKQQMADAYEYTDAYWKKVKRACGRAIRKVVQA